MLLVLENLVVAENQKVAIERMMVDILDLEYHPGLPIRRLAAQKGSVDSLVVPFTGFSYTQGM